MSDVLILHQPELKTSDNRLVPAIDLELKEIGPRAIDPKYVDFEVVGPKSYIDARAMGKPAKKLCLHRDQVLALRGKQADATERAKLAAENAELKRRLAALEPKPADGGLDPNSIGVGDELDQLTKNELTARAIKLGITVHKKTNKAALLLAIRAAEGTNEEE